MRLPDRIAEIRVYSDWRQRRNLAWLAKWDADHRWTRLAQYNAECSRGIVHTPEYDAAMAREQAAFNADHER